MNLQALGIETTDRDLVKVNEHYQTKVPTIRTQWQML